MSNYQVPSKAEEVTYCRKEVIPWECDEYLGVAPDLVEARKSVFGKSEPVFSPVFERRSRPALAVGAKEAMNGSVITHLSSTIQETIGNKW